MTLNPTDIVDVLSVLDQHDLPSLQIATAVHVASQYYPHFDPGQPVLLLGCADPVLLARLRAVLLTAYPPETAVTVLAGGARYTAMLADLAAAPVPCHLYLAARPAPAAYAALQDVAVHLRAPEGCPWDRALTWARLRSSLLEEAYELLAALDADRPEKVREELGDLLLQVALITEIATEAGLFRFPDVIAGIVDKLIRRHPHVFGDAQVSSEAEVLSNWEAIKAAERAQNGESRSPLAGIPPGLPALAQADAYLDRMSRLRVEAPPAAPWATLAAAGPADPISAETVGEALFGLVAWARARGIDAESALRAANARYAERVGDGG